ncbi:hypothetical protein [Sphingobacterium paludis]|uniref:Uncharacterized protein n=1 Tax=Sphingobacterium paludis TaxID=1476465 RepID=A0A4R7CT55_9SPHI|nr:hypothetical protein [Sphingobacterium paludis]TDS08400.1 hypothetical protein B0I21_11212 [Sphingobacterium paludis]
MSHRKLCDMQQYAIPQTIPAKVSSDGLLLLLAYKSTALSWLRTEGMWVGQS